MKKTISVFEIPEYIDGGDTARKNVVFGDEGKVVSSFELKTPVVIRFDFFRQGSTGAFDRRVLFGAPSLGGMDRQTILSETHFRCSEIAEDYRGKDVLLEIYISQKDIASKRRLRYIQESYHSLVSAFSEAGIEHQVIFEPLGASLNERIFSV